LQVSGLELKLLGKHSVTSSLTEYIQEYNIIAVAPLCQLQSKILKY